MRALWLQLAAIALFVVGLFGIFTRPQNVKTKPIK